MLWRFCLSVKRAPQLRHGRWWVWRRGRQTTSWLELILVTMAARASTPPGRTPWQVRLGRFRLVLSAHRNIKPLQRHWSCWYQRWGPLFIWAALCSKPSLLCIHYLKACRCLFVQTVYLIVDTSEPARYYQPTQTLRIHSWTRSHVCAAQISSGTATLFRGAYVSPSDDLKHNQVSRIYLPKLIFSRGGEQSRAWSCFVMLYFSDNKNPKKFKINTTKQERRLHLQYT